MKSLLKICVLALALAPLAACSTADEQERSALTTANQNAQEAKDQSAQALKAAQAAQTAAQQAEADAKAANEKADRMFQSSLRKK